MYDVPSHEGLPRRAPNIWKQLYMSNGQQGAVKADIRYVLGWYKVSLC